MNTHQISFVLAIVIGLSQGETINTSGPNHDYNLKHREELFSSMNKENKPCLDFYEYACGNWCSGHEAERDNYTSVIEMIDYEVNMEFLTFMENTSMDDKPEFVKKAHDFYTSCTKENVFKALPYMQWLEKHEGFIWALLTPANDTETSYDWVRTLAIMRKYGLNKNFISEMMYPQASESTTMMINITKNDDFYFVLHHHLEDLNETMNYPPNVQQFVDFYSEISDFEDLLRKLDEIEEIGEMESKKVTQLKDLPLTWIKKYLEIVFNEKSVDSHMEVTVGDMMYMEALEALLNEYDEKFLQRYLEIRFLLHMFWTYKHTSAKDCIKSTRGLMPMAMHWVYEHLHPEVEKEIPYLHEIFDKILKNIKQTLQSDKSGFITPQQLAKFDKLLFKVGNLPRDDAIHSLESFYGSLNLSNHDYYDNHMKLMKFYFEKSHKPSPYLNIENVNQFFNASENYFTGMDVKSMYWDASNLIIVPSELLRPPLYHWDYDKFFQQSSIGTIMAREIYSALDLINISSEDVEKIAGIGSFYSSYNVLFSDSADSLNEYHSIAEFMDMPLEQLFFLNAAQYYCDWLASPDTFQNLLFHLNEFNSAYDCKMHKFIKVFE
ncbi:membrane metallo-endopeptidase-like 1 [Haematobia irritans]|uniref:membrane metallo-endopeptidase-like 1 n=1 Tax=Haematobia irritans TaxID=7368 RepID=UPI003F4FA9F7